MSQFHRPQKMRAVWNYSNDIEDSSNDSEDDEVPRRIHSELKGNRDMPMTTLVHPNASKQNLGESPNIHKESRRHPKLMDMKGDQHNIPSHSRPKAVHNVVSSVKPRRARGSTCRNRVRTENYNLSSKGGVSSADGNVKNASRKQPDIVQYAVSYPLPTDLKKPVGQVQSSTGSLMNCANVEATDEDSKQKTMRSSKMRKMGFKKMESLMSKESNEILLTLCLPDNGFLELLETVGDKRNMIAYSLIAIGKACASSHRSNVLSLISSVTQNKKFMFYSVQQYLASFGNSRNDSYHLDSLCSLLQFLECYQKFLTASASDILPVIIPLFKLTCQKAFREMPEKLKMVENKIREIEEQQEQFIKNHSKEEIRKTSKSEKVSCQLPPENYRSIPVLPSQKDVWEHAPFLRPNVVRGKYSDAEHYLDVQFRLLREDYLRPLREGIATYMQLKKQGKSVSVNKEVRIYQNVHIIKQEFSNGRILHIASFNVKDFGRVNWEHSKRFLSGSLLCLSENDFETLFLASVALRDPEKLKKGILILQFEDLSIEILNFSPMQNFVMIETTAYFEAYRHNLSALQAMTSASFPLKSYIVDVEKDICSPSYLQACNLYDMKPLMKPVYNVDIPQIEVSSSSVFHDVLKMFSVLGEKSTSRSSRVNFESVAVLDDSQWPSKNDLGLDESQYKALKTAITKEFAIIQGPPGTGKTYVGLKIVQLLLHNSSKWSQGKVCPILIVCYTNHALDQFLEGIMSFTSEIVRVGGRCSNELLSEYQLQNRKQVIRQKREVPHHIFSNVKHQQFLLHQLEKEISKIRKEIDKSYFNILSHVELNVYISCYRQHYDSLMSNVTANAILRDDEIISNWLHIRLSDVEVWKQNNGGGELSRDDSNTSSSKFTVNEESVSSSKESVQSSVQYFQNSINAGSVRNELQNVIDGRNISVLNMEEDNEEVEEFDIDFIEQMREVDQEDFSDLQFIDETEMLEDLNLYANGNWQVKGEPAKRKQFIMNKLSDTVPFLESDAERIENIWQLKLNDRWRLYKYWVLKYRQAKEEESLQIQLQMRNEFEKLKEMKTEEDLFVLQTALVIGMTTTGAAKYRNLILNVKPRIVIVEEAAEVLEAHIVTSLVEDTQHLILIGDHQQLRPSPNVYELAIKFNLNISLFERMVKNGMDYCQLLMQHRMHPSIAKLLVPHIYPSLLNHNSVLTYEDIKGVTKNMYFISHSFMEGSEHDSKSHVNEHEAKFILQLCKYLLLQGYDTSQITILTAYSGQLFAIRKLAHKSELLKQVRVTVVDNFQGEENDIILISFVRSNDEGNIGFLKVSNRVCVALSRAKKGLFCVGNFSLLAQNSDLWKTILDILEKQEAVGPTLQLQCQNHKDVLTEVATEKDFNKVPEGGCMRLCEYRLECGHTCTRSCHSYDREHKNVRCQKPCTKVLCDYGHKCPKVCYKECGSCSVLVRKMLPACKHNVLVPCSVAPHEFQCPEPCNKTLPCMHNCKKKCSENCQPQACDEMIPVISLCGHTVLVKCCFSNDKKKLLSLCHEACQTVLQCGHVCKGTCSRCHQGRLHQACKSPCSRILVCGHECKLNCSKICPPCGRKCENRCVHSRCPKKCGQPCDTCMEPCQWSCQHQRCNELCGLHCNRVPCDEPCNKLLKCKHRCIGLCGEPCPDLCGVCQKENVRSIFFGTEDEIDARFVQLEDCGHVLEVQGLSHWMKQESGGEIQMKCCPKCKTVVRRNLRFGNAIKSCLRDIEKVKKVIYGDVETNNMKKQVLIKELGELKCFMDFNQLLQPMLNYLEKTRNISNPHVLRCENIIKIMREFLNIKGAKMYFNAIVEKMPQLMKIHLYVTQLLENVQATENLISEFISVEYLTASEQQLEEVTWELLRLKLQHKLIKFLDGFAGKSNNDSILYISQIVKCLCKLGPFRAKEEEVFNTSFEKLCKIGNAAVLNISDNEKKMILGAMSMTRGHWYQCPNGHVYCITECGGAMVESKCNECGAEIGGQSHTLRSDNRVATDMDGALHSAWSETANMMNYRF